jgi:hypothetical protein
LIALGKIERISSGTLVARAVVIVRESGEKIPVALRVGACGTYDETFVSWLDVDVGVEDPLYVDSFSSVEDVDDLVNEGRSDSVRHVSRATLIVSIA